MFRGLVILLVVKNLNDTYLENYLDKCFILKMNVQTTIGMYLVYFYHSFRANTKSIWTNLNTAHCRNIKIRVKCQQYFFYVFCAYATSRKTLFGQQIKLRTGVWRRPRGSTQYANTLYKLLLCVSDEIHIYYKYIVRLHLLVNCERL